MSELPGRTEVLVVGAGPVGLAVAALAHRLTRMATAPSAVRPLRKFGATPPRTRAGLPPPPGRATLRHRAPLSERAARNTFRWAILFDGAAPESNRPSVALPRRCS